MVSIIIKGDGGPSIFLTRLKRELERKNSLIDFKGIYLSTREHKLSSQERLVLRLDGLKWRESNCYSSINGCCKQECEGDFGINLMDEIYPKHFVC